MNEFIKEIVAALKQDKTKPYDTVAKVVRVDEKTAYVHIDGGAEETPAQMSINCKKGDTVRIRVSGGKAWLTGNITAPPTDDSETKQEISSVKKLYRKFKSKTTESFNAQDEKIKKAYKAATNFIKYIDDVGLIVGDMRNDKLGGNSLLDANGMAVRNGTAELVRFGTADIKIINELGEVIYSGIGSAIQSENNIVISTQQTKNTDDTNKGGKSALEMYYNSDSDTIGAALSLKKGTSYSDLYESEGQGLFLEYCIKNGAPCATTRLFGDLLHLQGDNAFLSGDDSVKINSGGDIRCYSPDIDCILGKNNVIWSGALYMNEGHTVPIESLVSKQATGIVLAWSHYDNTKNKADDWGWTFFFVPKQHVIWKNGCGIQMSDAYIGMNKYVYISDNEIRGNAVNVRAGTDNGLSYNSKNYVLRYVVGV